MNWSLLLLLACPLMMLFCMKGMFGGKKDGGSHGETETSVITQTKFNRMQIQMADLIEQNHNLMKEIQALKESSLQESSFSNVVDLKERVTNSDRKEIS
ncbi:DUF2933 domain-containing protein [Fodinisporobacter ferrooxydans]|uniref:DUF2933 domain-containing protein n=1 Tax=Fodinisporobacter ferrooxydans TaxID=2901836 RepID=A0ABY4CPZ6_9BACL|nr:DUF2933 domain-containing protein [Alicyclobacillaceae bacterium MYW30-H2]